MKRLLITVLMLTALLAGGVSRVQAAPPDPWEMIVHEALRESCAKAGKAPTDRPPAAEYAGPATGAGAELQGQYEMPGSHGMPFGGQRCMGGNPPPTMGPHHPDCIPCMLKILGLTDAQKKRIASIAREDREKSVASVEKREEIRRQLRAAERAATFDEKAVRSMAAKLAQIEADIIVARAKAHNRMGAVLTPLQRAIAEKMEPEFPCTPGPPPAGVSGK